MNPSHEREQALFFLAAAKPVGERAAFLERECGGDKALRARLEALLAAHERTEAMMDAPVAQAKATMKLAFSEPPDESIGQKIGRYKILEKVGEGGCGVVYVAEQIEPVRRRVALKVIKLGMDTKQVVARFEAERQALAMMDHPNIARVLDAGSTETGRPYFIMELVRGIRITDYCDQNNLSTKERLEQFMKVCQAIQHAHQKGIIHRDIKPSNILVTLHDGVPVPKVIDFGIAKATEGRLTDATVYTQLNQFIGTPAYMSPEQAEMSGLDIDTRSDIYSLGVLLYELLTGKTPFDAQELISQGIDQMRKTIRETDPVRPSTKLGTLQGDELTTTAKRRSVESSKLARLLRGELDWIVMKCLEKDRTRRYDTANGLGMDLKRHLNNEPVLACPPSKLYEFQKTVRRHKFGFAATAAIMMVLAAGIALSTWQAARARRESRRATAALEELRQAAPVFAAEARSLAAQERFDEAIIKLDSAIRLRRDLPDYLVAKGDLLQCQLKLAEAAAVYREAMRVQPGLARAEESAKLCDDLLAAEPDKQGKLSCASLANLRRAMLKQHRPAAEFLPMARLFREALTGFLQKGGFKFTLEQLPEGMFSLEIVDQPFSDLSFLEDAPVSKLTLYGTRVSDLRPLTNLPLARLDIRMTQVTDLSPLRAPVLSASLRELYLWKIPATVFSPIAACTNLELLDAASTALDSLEVVRGRKLRVALLFGTRITDISVLAGMPLERVGLDGTAVTDISPLLQCPTLQNLMLPAGARNVEALRSLPTLNGLSYSGNSGFSSQAAEDFWLEYENRGLTAEAVSTLSSKSIQNPQDNLLVMKVAGLQAWFGLDSDYAATCKRLIEAAERVPDDGYQRECAAKNWCLRPSNDAAMLQRVLNLAREAAKTELVLDQRPWYQQTLGMAEFRAGNGDAAEAAFLRAEQAAEAGNWHPDLRPFIQGPSWFYRAMMLFRKGKTDEAKALFQKAEAQMPPIPENAVQVLPTDVTQDQLLCWLAYKEAKALLLIPATAAKP